MLAMASAENLSIAELQYKNERAYRSERDIEAGIDGLWVVMQAYVRWGLTQGDPMMSPGRACRLEIRPSPQSSPHFGNGENSVELVCL